MQKVEILRSNGSIAWKGIAIRTETRSNEEINGIGDKSEHLIYLRTGDEDEDFPESHPERKEASASINRVRYL